MKNFIILILILTTQLLYSQENNSQYDFSLQQYKDFLIKLKQNPDIIFVKQKDFKSFNDPSKIVVSLRHDVDLDIANAISMAEIENYLDIPATYFILHTANYYHPKNDFSTHNDSILNKMLFIQSLGHEIGIHNDLITLQIIYHISPTCFLSNELQWMRTNGLKIYGSASHGSHYCHEYHYLNYFFFNECSINNNPDYYNKDSVLIDDKYIKFEKANLSDFNLFYEGYFINHNKYYSDCSRDASGNRNNPTKTDISDWKKGDKIIFLFHPVHWKKYINTEKYIYPNPCYNFFCLNIDDLENSTPMIIKIFNLSGIQVLNEHINYEPGRRINTNLPEGIYIVNIEYTKNDLKRTYSEKLFIK